MAYLLRTVIFIYALISISLASANTDSTLILGHSWLQNQQQIDGGVYQLTDIATAEQSTAESIIAVNLWSNTTIDLAKATAYFTLTELSQLTTEALWQLVRTKSYQPEQVDELIKEILRRQNADGGFGYLEGYSSGSLDTSWALESLYLLNSQSNKAGYALAYLEKTQFTDGSWPINESSSLVTTSQVSKSIWHYRHKYVNVPNLLARSQAYLLANKGHSTNLFELSELLSAVLANLDDLALVEDDFNLLKSQQQANGSWQDDVFVTAKILQLLTKAATGQTNPDLLAIRGAIFDGDTKLPLPSVSVALAGDSNQVAVTKSDGSFHFGKLKAGSYNLQINAKGYQELTWSGYIAAGDSRDLGSLMLTKVTDVPNPTHAVVIGQVLDKESNQPLDGVTVSVAGQGKSAVTGSDGRYQIAEIKPGKILLQAQKIGFSGAAAEVTLAAGQSALFSPKLSVAKTLSTSIAGLISLANGDVSGAKVSLSGSNNKSLVLTTTGQFSFEGLQSGSTTLTVAFDGYHTLSVEINIIEGINYQFNQQLIPIDVTQPELKAELFGAVLASDTKLPLNADVNLTVNGVVNNVKTNSEGRFIFTELTAASDAVLSISMAGYQDLSIPLDLVAGTSLNMGELELLLSDVNALYSFKGVVVDSQTNLPLSGVFVQASTETSTYSAMTDSNGVFELLNIDSSHVSLTFANSGYKSSSFLIIGEANNTVDLGQVRMRPEGLDSYLPDLAVLDVSKNLVVSDQVSLNISGSIVTRVANASVQDVNRPFEAVAFFDSNNNGEFDNQIDEQLGSTSISSLLANQQVEIEIVLEGKARFVDFPILVALDPEQLVIESDEVNNVGGGNCRQDCALFSDLFSFGRSVKWADYPVNVSDIWSVLEGRLTASPIGGMSLVGDESWINYSITTDIRFDDLSNYKAGLIFRAQDADNRYQINFDNGVIYLINVANGVESNELVSAAYSFTTNDWTAVKVDVVDKTVKVQINEQLVLEYSSLELVSGGAGLSHSGAQVSFDNYIVDRPLASLTPKVKWHWSGPGSANSHYNQVMSIPVVAQLNDDNSDGAINQLDTPDVIFSTFYSSQYEYPAVLRVVSGADGKEIWSSPAHTTSIHGPAVGDIDGDGLVEIVIGGGNWRGTKSLRVYENDGSLKWSVPVSQFGEISLADINNDGAVEIITVNTVFDSSGNELWRGGVRETFSLVLDLDLDGDQEVFGAGTAYDTDGSVLWSTSTKWARGAVGNFDTDDNPEIVAVSSTSNNGHIVMLEHDGSVKWGPVSVPGGGGGPVTIADVDADGEPEIGIAGANYYVVFEGDGSVKWTSKTQDFSSRVTGSSVFDFDGDGRAEILYSDENNFRIYDGETGKTLHTMRNPSGTLYEYPLVVDIDNDDHAEIVLVSNNYAFTGTTGIRVLEGENDDWMPTRSIWNQHSYHITNVNDDGTIPQFEKPSWLTHNNYRLNTFIDRDAREQYDLTLSKLTLSDNGVGNPMSLSVRIGNAGLINSQPTLVEFYKGTVSAETKLGEASVPLLVPNTYADIVFDNVTGVASGDDLIAVVNNTFKTNECDINNNEQLINASAVVGSITLQLSQSAFLAGETAIISATVNNTGLFVSDYNVVWQVNDNSGALVEVLPPQEFSQLASNASVPFTTELPLGNLVAGSYVVKAQLYSSEVILDETQNSFSILATGIDGSKASVSATLATDKATYKGFDSVELLGRARNTATNTQQPASVATLTITDITGKELFKEVFSAQVLSAQSIRDLNARFKLSNAATGMYHANLTLVDQLSAEVVATATTSFNVIADDLQAISGTTIASAEFISSGEPITCSHEAKYEGSNDAQIELQYLLLRVDTQQVVSTDSIADSFTTGSVKQHDSAISTGALTTGRYTCLQLAKQGENQITLSNASFDVTSPQFKVTGQLALGDKPRLLVLVDALPQDVNTQEHLQEMRQRESLEALLQEAGWLFTLVDSEAVFESEMQSGGYSVYALMTETVTLATHIQEALNQKIALGDGLIVSQGTEDLYPLLEASTGVDVRDYDLTASVIEHKVGSVYAQSLVKELSRERPVLNFKLKQAELAAQYVGSNTTGPLKESPFGVAGQYNAITFGNFTAPSSTVEGRLAVGGNLDVDGYSVGDKLTYQGQLTNTLVVGGDISFPTGRVYFGNIVAGGLIDNIGSAVTDGIEPGAVILGKIENLPLSFNAAEQYTGDLSSSLASLPNSGEVAVKWGGYYLSGDGVSNVQVFNVDTVTLANVHTFAVSDVPQGATLIFNIHGDFADVSNISFEDMKGHAYTTVYNFPDATSIHFNGVKMQGSVLAPKANIEKPNGDIFGQLISKSWNGVMSISLYGFSGNLSGAIDKLELANAISINTHKQGKAAFVGFDLLDEMALENVRGTADFSHSLLSLLESVKPLVQPIAGKVLPVVLTIQNEKAATAGSAYLELPNGAQLIEGDFSDVENQLQFTFSLEEAQVVTTQFYIQLPKQAANDELVVELFTGTKPNLQSHAKLVLAVATNQ